jgi:hypothetical protein
MVFVTGPALVMRYGISQGFGMTIPAIDETVLTQQRKGCQGMIEGSGIDTVSERLNRMTLQAI